MQAQQRRIILQNELAEKFGSLVTFEEPLSRYTTFKIGGPAFALAQPHSVEEIAALIAWCNAQHVPFFVMGGGSNLLCDSVGYDGVVIALSADEFCAVDCEDGIFSAGAGARLRTVVNATLDAGFESLSFLGGIPGTLGGAVAMNAGTRERWIDEVVARVEVVDIASGTVKVLEHDDISWGYRYSSLRDNSIITRVIFKPLKRGAVEDVRKVMSEAFARRKATQPLLYPNAGSVFKNPEGASSGALIEACGLKGFSRGGAMVSPQHANFIVNTGSATSDDVRALVAHIQDEVYKRYGIKLKTEIRFLPE